MHNITKPARDVAGKVSAANTAVRRKMGDYSDAPLIDFDGNGMLQRQAKKTGKAAGKVLNKINDVINGNKYHK